MNEDAIRIPENGIVEVSIQHAIRKSTRMPVSPASLVQHFRIITKFVIGNLKGTFQAQRQDVITFLYSRYYTIVATNIQ